MRIPVLIFSLIYASTAIAQETSRGEASASLTAGGSSQDGVSNFNLGGTLGYTAWLGRRLMDDGAPLSLQTYLQRPNLLSLAANGGGSWTSYESPFRRIGSSSGRQYGLSVGGSGWISKIFLGGSILAERYTKTLTFSSPSGVPYSESQTTNTPQTDTLTLVAPGLRFGVRAGVFEFDLDYQLRLKMNDGQLLPPNWGTLDLAFRWASRRAVYYHLHLYNLDGEGAGTGFHFAAYAGSRLDIFGGANVETGRVYINSAESYMRYAHNLGVGIWATRRFRVQLVANVWGTQAGAGGSTMWQGSITGAVTWRVP